MATFLKGILLLISIFSIDCLAIPKKSGGLHRQSKAGHLSEQPLAPMGSQNQHQPEPIDRASYDMSADALPSGFSSGENDPSKQNVFFTDAAAPLPKANSGQQVGATFENIAPSYIGPNYMVNGVGHGGGGSVSRNSHDDGTMTGGELLSGLGFPGSQGNPLNNYYQSLLSAAGQLHGNNVQSAEKPSEDTINDVFNNAFKKYNVKKYLLQKIFGKSHDMDTEDENGFFSNKHLKRHGTAGMAAKVLGELIGIKIRESIEGFGKSFSEYAKDFTSRNFVNMGQVFSRMLKFQ